MIFRLACCLCALLPAAAAASLRIEAHEATERTAGAKQGLVWNLWSNGELAEFVDIPADGEYTVTVRAYGSPAKGVWPQMALLVDDDEKQTVSVAAALQEYTFTVPIKQGLHKIAVAFVNDAVSEGEDRNLYVDYIEIGPDAALGSAKEWQAAWTALAADAEARAVADARATIETVRQGDCTLTIFDSTGQAVGNAEVSVSLANHEFLFGCNIFGFDAFESPQKNEEYKAKFRAVFNYATTGFYWRSYESQRGKPLYEKTDRVLQWCAENGIRVKGHPLLWDHEAGVPHWAGGQPSPEIQEQRVREIVRRFKGRIEFWEVVNEPAHVLGVPIDEPYRWAREEDPTAHLIVNDYEVLANGCPPFYVLLESSISKGVPFDGIGIQAHEPITMRFPLHRVTAILDRYAKLGKAIHITELAFTSAGRPITGSHVTGNWTEQTQAEYADLFYTVCFAHPAVVAITWWDLSDARSWQKGGGLLREDLSPKPAYQAIKQLIRQKWSTNVSGTTDADGRFAFRGFYGTYAITVRRGTQTLRGDVQWRKSGPATVGTVVK